MNFDAIPWLLEGSNPSVRFLALTRLLNRSVDDPEVLEAQAAIAKSKPARAIFTRQDAAGWWDTPERAYGMRRASGQLLALAQTGVIHDERTQRGCEFVLSKPWVPIRGQQHIPLCYTANCLRFLSHFGYCDDPRLDPGWDALAGRLMGEQPLRCRYEKRPCNWLAVKALWAFAVAPRERDMTAVAARTAEALLSYKFDFEAREARWLRLGFPWYFQSDLLDALEALAVWGHAADSRFGSLAQHILDKETEDGRWLKEGGSTAVPIERRGQPSKWITLKALRVQKSMEDVAMRRS
jgi:hypothetical protein